jgi:hypothetical protein
MNDETGALLPLVAMMTTLGMRTRAKWTICRAMCWIAGTWITGMSVFVARAIGQDAS